MLLQHSIIGLPFSGKTTFLAALWHLLNANEVPSKVVLDKLVGDHEHLNAIAEAWRKCEQVPRTSMAAEVKVAIHVKDVSNGQVAVLHFPDLSGESFERQLTSRQCATDYVENFEGAGGVLLFVTANRGLDGMSIVEVAPLLHGETVEENSRDHREWNPKMVSAQVNLVDLLQFLQQFPFLRRTRRVAVIVSAWDVIDNPNLAPYQWLLREFPLLHQFLTSNPSSFEFQVYGVSAQGGDVNSERKMELALKIPSTRITCVGPDADSHDLTSPIAWLMARE